jgi:hypothetical protein
MSSRRASGFVTPNVGVQRAPKAIRWNDLLWRIFNSRELHAMPTGGCARAWLAIVRRPRDRMDDLTSGSHLGPHVHRLGAACNKAVSRVAVCSSFSTSTPLRTFDPTFNTGHRR